MVVRYILAFLVALPATLLAEQGERQRVAFDRDQALEASRGALGTLAPDVELRMPDGTEVQLSQFLGKPVVISLIFTSCYHICPTTTQHLKDVVRKARALVGTDRFTVLTIGFDVFRDTPQMMQYFANQQRVSEAGWYFLSADQPAIDKLTASLGFVYYETANGFDHLIQTTLLDGQGRVHRQIYGLDFDTPVLVEPLKSLILGDDSGAGLVQTFSDRFRLFCTVYDPSQDKYRVDYSIIMGTIIGFLCVGVLGFALFREWRHSINRGG